MKEECQRRAENISLVAYCLFPDEMEERARTEPSWDKEEERRLHIYANRVSFRVREAEYDLQRIKRELKQHLMHCQECLSSYKEFVERITDGISQLDELRDFNYQQIYSHLDFLQIFSDG